MFEIPPERAARIAYAAAALNLAAALAMLFLLKRGLPVPGSVTSVRLGFIRSHLGLWWSSWLLWHAAAISLVLFLLVLAERFRRQAPVRAAIAVIAAVAGLSADLAAEAIYMGVAPRLEEGGFRVAEATAGILTGHLGNGLYTLAGILLTWAGARQLPRAALLLSIPLWGAGLSLAAATLLQTPAVQLWATAVLMPLFVLWAALVGKWLSRSAS